MVEANDIYETLVRKDMLGILMALQEPKTIAEAAEESGVPKPTVYKRVHELEEYGIVKEKGKEYRGASTWQSLVYEIEIVLNKFTINVLSRRVYEE